jgi:phage terminase large subunit
MKLRIETPRVFLPLLNHARYLGAHGGRGSGKSHFFAEKLVERCLYHHRTRAVCLREIQNSLDESVKQLLEDKIGKLGVENRFTIRDKWIETPGGGLIIFKGLRTYNAASIKSLEGFDIAWVEEAQSVSKRSLDILRPTIRNVGSELWFSWNPDKEDDPVEQLLRTGPNRVLPPDAIVVQANWSDNPWLPPDLRQEKNWDKRDPDKYDHVWEGGYQRNSEARVFNNWRVEAFDTPEDARFYFGADWGYAVDPSVLVRLFMGDRRKLYIDREAYQIGCEIDHLPALFNTVPGSAIWPSTADSARPETISYMQRHGFPKMKAAVKGQGSVEDGIEFMKNFDIIVHPRCKHTIKELTHYSWKIDQKTNEILPVLSDKDNHVMDACRYAVEATRRATYGMLEVV